MVTKRPKEHADIVRICRCRGVASDHAALALRVPRADGRGRYGDRVVKPGHDLNQRAEAAGLGAGERRLGYQVALSILGLLGGYVLASLTFWLGPLALVPAVVFTLLAFSANGPSWRRPLATGGGAGAALPWLIMLGNSFV